MTSNHISKEILKAFATIIGIGLLFYFLYTIRIVLIYILIATVLALVARPIILFLRKKLKFPNVLAVLLILVGFIGIFVGILSLFIPLVIEQSENLSLLKTKDLEKSLEVIFVEIDNYLKLNNINIINELKKTDIASKLTQIPNLINSVISTFGTFSAGVFSVLFISFFFMKDGLLLKRVLLTITPKGKERKTYQSIEKINNLLSRYFIGLFIQIIIIFILYSTVLLIFDISNAIVIAFLCALLNIIPYVGPIIGGLLMFILSMTSNIGMDFQTQILPTTMYVMIGFLLAQLFDNLVSQPKIFSTATKAHPLEIFIVILIGGILMGAIGMIVAVPTYTALRVILKEFLADNKIVKSITKNI